MQYTWLMAVVEVQYLYHPHSLVLCRGRASKSMTVHAVQFHFCTSLCHRATSLMSSSPFHCVGVGQLVLTMAPRFLVSMGRDVFTPFSQHSREEGSSSTQTLKCSYCDGDTSSLALTVENIRWPRTAENTTSRATKSGSRDDVATCNLVATRMTCR